MADWENLSENERHFVTHVLAFFAASDGHLDVQRQQLFTFSSCPFVPRLREKNIDLRPAKTLGPNPKWQVWLRFGHES